MSNDFYISLIICLSLIGFGIFAFNHQLGKNRDLKPRRLPWIFLGMAAFATAFMMLVHLVNLLGIETGRR